MARVLIQGVPFLSGHAAISRYAGAHEVRWMCGLPNAPEQGYHLRYDLTRDSLENVFAALAPWRPDLLLFFQPEDQCPPRGGEHSPVKTAAVPADWSHTFPRIHGAIGRFDVAAFDYPGVARANWRGHCLPQYFGPTCGFQPELHRDLHLPRDIDVLYAGSMNHALRPERGVLLPRLHALDSRYRVHITSGVYGEDYVRLTNRAKLVFNYSSRGELNLRFFETLACGAIPMVERENVEARRELPEHPALCLFDLEDFEAAIARVLDAPDGGEAQREQAAALACDYLPERMLDRFIDGALGAPSSGRPFLGLPPQEQAYYTLMAHSGSAFPVVRAVEAELLRDYATKYEHDPRTWTLMARRVLTPKFHLFMHCGNEEELKAPARQALDTAAALAPADVLHLANAAWAAHWCGDADAARAYAVRALDADTLAHPELIVGSAEDPAWARFMLATAEGQPPESLRLLLSEMLQRYL